MLKKIQNQIQAYSAQLIAVSKTKSNAQIMELYELGQRDFGENRVLELAEKYETLPKDIKWHFIGHLQTNKVKYLVPFVHLIHSVDRFKVLKEINKQALKEDKVINCLIQFHIAEESSKFGFDIQEAREMLESEAYQMMQNVRFVGVMGMGTFTDNMDQVRKEFQQLKSLFDELKINYFPTDDAFKEISMGMSGDYMLALEESSTMVRIGTLLFGKR